jgi:hypothetical protein
MSANQRPEFSTRPQHDVVLDRGDPSQATIVTVAASRASKTVTLVRVRAREKNIALTHYFLACGCRTCILQMRIRFAIKDERRLGGRE